MNFRHRWRKIRRQCRAGGSAAAVWLNLMIGMRCAYDIDVARDDPIASVVVVSLTPLEFSSSVS